MRHTRARPVGDEEAADAVRGMRLRRGPLMMIGATLAFTVMIAAVRSLRQDLSPFDVMLWRSAVAVPMVGALAWSGGLGVTNRRLLAVRCLLGFGAMVCFFTSARGLLVTELSLIQKLQPLWVVVLAPIFLGRAERSGWGVAVAMALGLAGCAVLLGVDLEGDPEAWAERQVYGAWALGATVFSAAAHLCLRSLGATERPANIVFWFQVAVTGGALAAVLAAGGPVLPEPRLWAPLFVVGLAAGTGQLLLTGAYQEDRAAVVAGASYTGPVFAVIGDVIVFGVVPGANAWWGGLLVVVGGGILLGLRDERR